MALKSEGQCVYCDKIYKKAGISRHLATHLKEAHNPKGRSKAFHVQVNAAEMFLHVLVNGSKPLQYLDDFLRAIWLECCGHMSSFRVKGVQYDYTWDATEFGEKMGQKMSNVFTKGMILEYEYDFGSTTQLGIKVVNQYNISVPSGVKLLSRNEPLEILCHTCEKKAAVKICSIHLYDGPSFFCTSCAKKHAKSCGDFADYAAMSVVNSPRMGVCAYDGGSIDTKRDGVWKP